jgi:transposase
MKKHHEPEPSRIDISEGEAENLITEIRQSNLKAETQELVVRVILGWGWLSRSLEQKKLSIKKLLRIFFGFKTEKTKPKNKPKKKDTADKGEEKGASSSNESSSSVNSDGPATATSTPPAPSSNPKPKGHGKTGQKDYASAERMKVPHPSLKEKESCPSCGLGRLYSLGVACVLRFFGQAPIQAKVFELEQLRCSSCQEVFTAPLPESAGFNRHHESANAMVSFLNYGAGVPFYRLEGIQEQLGVPLADATQFDMAEKVANAGQAVVEHMKKLASNAETQGIDDTSMPVLSLMKENEEKTQRTGMQTTAVTATSNDQKMALFTTGRNHAGENVGALLKDRNPQLGKVIQMSDAAPCNFSHDFMDLVTKALCLDHGRRNFYEILDEFPKDAKHVIDELGKVYKNEAQAKSASLSNDDRLVFHQTHSQPVLNDLNAWMEEKLENHEIEPNSPLGQAIAYFLKHWNGLTVFLRVPGAPLSNAETEQLIKRCVLRRKNSMFYKTLAGAWIGDVLMSLIETARYHKKNPIDYLSALQKYACKAREHPENWLPWTYQQTMATL